MSVSPEEAKALWERDTGRSWDETWYDDLWAKSRPSEQYLNIAHEIHEKICDLLKNPEAVDDFRATWLSIRIELQKLKRNLGLRDVRPPPYTNVNIENVQRGIDRIIAHLFVSTNDEPLRMQIREMEKDLYPTS